MNRLISDLAVPGAAVSLVGVLVGVLVGCGREEGRPSTRITTPRILAVQAEPPVVALGQDATLSPLLAGVDASVPVTWQFRVCNPWRIIVDPAVDCGPFDSLPLESASLENGEGAWLRPLDVLAAFPPPPWFDPGEFGGSQPGTGDPGDPGDPECAMRYDFVEVVVVVEALIPSVGDTAEIYLVATKRVRVTFEPVERGNPVIENLTLDDESNPETFTPGRDYELTVTPRQDSLDVVCNDDGVGVMERVRVYVFTDAGQFQNRSIRIEYSAEGEETAGSTVWTAPDQGDATLWLVGTDRDGGVGWLRVELSAAR